MLAGRSITTTYFLMTPPLSRTSSCWRWQRCGRSRWRRRAATLLEEVMEPELVMELEQLALMSKAVMMMMMMMKLRRVRPTATVGHDVNV